MRIDQPLGAARHWVQHEIRNRLCASVAILAQVTLGVASEQSCAISAMAARSPPARRRRCYICCGRRPLPSDRSRSPPCNVTGTSRGQSVSLPGASDLASPLLRGPLSRIAKTEERAISVEQLANLRAKIKERYTQWIDWNGKRLTAVRVNLYDVNQNLIKPDTEAHRCSYVELVASGPQIPKWFVSHWYYIDTDPQDPDSTPCWTQTTLRHSHPGPDLQIGGESRHLIL